MTAGGDCCRHYFDAVAAAVAPFPSLTGDSVGRVATVEAYHRLPRPADKPAGVPSWGMNASAAVSWSCRTMVDRSGSRCCYRSTHHCCCCPTAPVVARVRIGRSLCRHRHHHHCRPSALAHWKEARFAARAGMVWRAEAASVRHCPGRPRLHWLQRRRADPPHHPHARGPTARGVAVLRSRTQPCLAWPAPTRRTRAAVDCCAADDHHHHHCHRWSRARLRPVLPVRRPSAGLASAPGSISPSA